MNNIIKNVPELEFSKKYTDGHARAYFHKHTVGCWRILSNRREINIARKALRLAGYPRTILDLPCGTGRFWHMLTEDDSRKLYAADYNQSMLNVAMEVRPQSDVQRFETFQASAFNIPRPDNFVNCIFSMRLLHHIGEHEDRMRMLREFHRVTSDSVVVSLWVDGNYRAHMRAKQEGSRKNRRYQNRFLQPRERIEAEMHDAGFDIVSHIDFFRYFSMWRVYVLHKR